MDSTQKSTKQSSNEDWLSGYQAAKEQAASLMVFCRIAEPGTGPFTRMDMAIEDYKEAILAMEPRQ